MLREKEGDLTQSYDKTPYTNRKFENQRTTHTNATKNFDYITIADLGRSVGVTSNPTGVVKPVYGIPTFPLTILSWTCHVYGPFEFWTSLGTSILLLRPSDPDVEVWHTVGKIILGYVFCTKSPNVQTIDNITFFKEKGRDLTQSCIRQVIYCCFLHILATGEICWSLDKFIWLIVFLHQRVEMPVAMTQTP